MAQGRACVWPGHEAPTQLPTPTLLSLIWASLAEGACPYCVPGSERGAGKHGAGHACPYPACRWHRAVARTQQALPQAGGMAA